MALDINSFMPAEEECLKTLREMRWGKGTAVRCPNCNSMNVNRDGLRGIYQMYWCKDCDSYFNDRSGTIFQDTKVSLRKWFMIAFLMQFKIPVTEISKTVGISYRKSFDIVKKIRSSIYANKIVEKLRGTIEMDEVYVTSGLKGKKGHTQGAPL